MTPKHRYYIKLVATSVKCNIFIDFVMLQFRRKKNPKWPLVFWLGQHTKVIVGGENLVFETSQLRHQSSQMWQERRLCHKRGKRDVSVKNVARETLTWKERCQSGKSDINVARPTLSGNMNFFFLNFLYFATIWTILSITPQIKRRNFYHVPARS